MVSVNFKIEKHSTRRVNIRLALDWLFEQRSLELIIRDFFFFKQMCGPQGVQLAI